MFTYTDPSTALTMARHHQADVRSAFGRRLPRPFGFPRPAPRRGGITAVPALPGDATAQPSEHPGAHAA